MKIYKVKISLGIDIDGKINYDKAFELFKNKDVNLDYDDNKNIHNLSNFEFRERGYKAKLILKAQKL